jgi:hypothetical protein
MLIRSMSTSQPLICQCLSEACQHHNSFRIHGCQVAINILSVREIIFYLLPAIFCLTERCVSRTFNIVQTTYFGWTDMCAK